MLTECSGAQPIAYDCVFQRIHAQTSLQATRTSCFESHGDAGSPASMPESWGLPINESMSPQVTSEGMLLVHPCPAYVDASITSIAELSKKQ